MTDFSSGCGTRTIGLDLGDRFSHFCTLSDSGEILEEGRITTTPAGFRARFEREPPCRVVMEVGTHSPWVSRLLTSLGHAPIVANARRLRLIFENSRKSDRVDAEALARVGRLDPKLLHAVEHRDLPLAQDLATIKGRDVLVRSRTQLVNHVRGIAKANGERIPKSSTTSIARKPFEVLSEPVRQVMQPLMNAIGALTEQIAKLDERIEELGRIRYPETSLLRTIDGVGPLISLTFVLTIGEVERFKKARDVGPYLGLVPARAQSGASDPQRRISKEGDPLLRRYLVQAAQRILGPFGKDCDLRRFGLALAARGGAHAKKRAIVAVARKLSVLMLHLLKSGEVYEALRMSDKDSPSPKIDVTGIPAPATARKERRLKGKTGKAKPAGKKRAA